MNTIKVNEGTTIYYKEWCPGPLGTFYHGWPRSAIACGMVKCSFLPRASFVSLHTIGAGEAARVSRRPGTTDTLMPPTLERCPTPYDLKQTTLVGRSAGGGEGYKGLAVPFCGTNRPDAKVSQGGTPHGLTVTHQDIVNTALFAFLRA